MTETQEMSLTVFDPSKAAIAEIVERDSNLVFDHSTPDGEAELRSYVYRIKRHKGDLEKVRKEAKSGALNFGRKVDEIAKELNKPLLTIIADRMKPLDEIEEKKRAAAEAAVEAERLEAERIETERLADLKKREAEVEAKEAKLKAIDERVKAHQADLDRAAREKRIADEAADNAKKQAKIDADAALAKAESDKQVAIEAEQDKAVKVEADRIAEEKRVADENAKRYADKVHRDEIETKIHNAFHKQTDDYDMATEILSWIIDGKIPHLKINY